jgi:hypothetical protein
MAIDPIVRTIFLTGFWTVIGVLGWSYLQTGDKWAMFPTPSRFQKVLYLVGFGLILFACVAGAVSS